MNPTEILVAGALELAPVLSAERFSFASTDSGRSSGGNYASGEYRRDDRWLELHFRHSLGLVAYHVADLGIEHADYVRAVRALDGVVEKQQYPGFEQEPIAQFRALGADIQSFGARFLRGTREQFRELRDWLDQHPQPKGLAALP